MKLRPYQELAADFIYSNDRSMILAPVGAGKTAITITAMQDMIRDGIAKRFIVFAPKRVCTSVWPVEIPKFAPLMTFALATGGGEQRRAAVEGPASVVLVNYDVSVQLAEQYPDLSRYFDGVVLDELTRFKAAGDTRSRKDSVKKKAKRFVAAYRALEKIQIRIGLTGSFTSNGLEDTFGQCKMIDATLLGATKSHFLAQYFFRMGGDRGETIPRPGALQRVMERIKPATFVLEAGEYADKLPPLHIAPMLCDMDMTAYKEMKKNLVLQAQGETITAVNAAVMTGKLLQLAGGWVYSTSERPDPNKPGKWIVDKTPVWLSSHKFDLLDEVLAENQRAPTIVVYNFVEELAELRRRYAHLQTMDDKNVIDRWNAGSVELLALHPKSAGHGINLQGQSRMVFLSLPWSLELYEQVIGRIHRGGQKHPVWVYPLLTRDTVDERMFQGLQDKKDMAQIALAELVK